MALDSNDARIALDDARARHAAVVALIYFTEQQAMGLLRLYTTLSLAAASAAAAGFLHTAQLPRPLQFALLGATAVLLFGAGNCLAAMKSAAISLPGRDPDFWIWATEESVTREQWIEAYLSNLNGKAKANRDLNKRSARALARAKLCAIAAPLAALLGAVVGTFA